MKKVLTVAVPMYQVQQYIKKCLESFLVQEIEQKVEILAVDDGSFDGTSAAAKQYARKYPHMIRYIRKENGGHGSAVNTAMRYAGGKYFMVVDGDDWVRQEDFRELVMQLEKLDADLAVSHYVRVKGRKETVVYTKAPLYGTVLPFACLQAAGCYAALPSICYRTELLKKAALHLPEHSYYDDLVYMTKPMWLVQTVVFLDLAPYQYRVGTAAQSTSKKQMADNAVQHRKMVCRLFYDYSSKKGSGKKGSDKKESAQEQYIRTAVCRAFLDHYYIFLQCEPNMRLAAVRLKQTDAFLRKQDAPMFKELSCQIRFLKLLRKSGYALLPAYRCKSMAKGLLKLLQGSYVKGESMR